MYTEAQSRQPGVLNFEKLAMTSQKHYQLENNFQFCPDHKNDTGPVVLAENLSEETKSKLKQSRSLKYYAQGLAIDL